MDRAADYDEQSEVLFLFTEDADDTQPQTDNQPHPTPPQPTTSPTTSEPPQPPTTFSADQSFWAGVYTLHPPHALMGVLTDLHVHRFILHQHLDTHTALAETPIGHQPLTDTLPQPIQRIIAIYHNNVQRAQHHTRLALNAIDTLARFPPAAYFTDPNLTTPDPQHTHTHTPKQLPHPATSRHFDSTQYQPPLTNGRPCKMQPPKLLHLGSPFLTTHSRLQVSSNHNRPPHERTPITATSRQTLMPLSNIPPLQAS